MKTTKRLILTLVAILGMTGAWAQDAEEVAVSKTANNNEWTLTMPAFDVELQVEYYDELMGDDGTDNTTLLASLDGQTTDIYLNRTLAKEKWYTLCLPFDVDLTADGPLKGVTAKTLSKVENGGSTVTLTFGDAETSLAAGKPYIVRLPEGAIDDLINPLFEGATISGTLNDVAVDGGTFKGTYAKVDWAAGTKDVLFLQDNTFYYPESEAWVNAFRAYIKLTTPVTAEAKVILDFGGDDEVTGIATVESDSQLSTANSQFEEVWYTLQGVQLDGKPSEKGIYIVNGKKVAIL